MVQVNLAKIRNEGIELSEYLNKELENNESELYVFNGDLYKILDPTLRQKRKRIMEYLFEIQKDLPIDILDIAYENNNFVGYIMKLYEEYITLYKMLKSNISLNERKKIALLLVDIYAKFKSFGLIYFDWHSKNSMAKETNNSFDIKSLDIDSILQTNNVEYDAKSRRYLLNNCTSVILGEDLDFDYRISESKKEEIFESLYDKEEIYLSKTIPLDLEFIKKEIEQYTSTKVDYQKELIRKRIKIA